MSRAGRIGALLGAAAALIGVAAFLGMAWGGWGSATGTGWSAPAPIGVDADAAGVEVAIDGAGGLHLAWFDRRQGRSALFYRYRSPGGEWTEPQRVTESRWWIRRPTLAVNGRGDVVVLWELASRRQSTLRASVRLAGEAWEPPQTLAPVARGFHSVEVAIDERGGISAAWSSVGGGDSTWGLRRPAGEGWRDPVQLAGLRSGLPIALDVSASGKTLVVTGDAERPGTARLVAVSATPDGRWSAPRGLGRQLPGARLAVALDDRRAVAAWVGPPETGARRRGVLRAAEGSPDGRFGAPRVLDRGRDDTFGDLVALRDGPRSVVAWGRWGPRADGGAIHAAVLGGDASTSSRVARWAVPAQEAEARFAPPPPHLRGVAGDGVVTLAWSRAGGPPAAPLMRVESSSLGRDEYAWGSIEAVPGRSQILIARAVSGSESVVRAVLLAGSLDSPRYELIESELRR